MAYDFEKERHRRLQANNVIGAFAGLMFLVLLLIGALIAILLTPLMVTTVPPPIPRQEEHTGEE